jgi:leucyl-tRNA synthetase
LLTRQAKFLRDTLKTFRAQAGKAKKGATKGSVVITDSYPAWKIKVLMWMNEKYNPDKNSFPDTFMKELKGWAAENAEDKRMIKLTMQFVSFVKKEVEEVGPAAMDTTLPFDQLEILKGSERYLKKQLVIEDLDFIRVGGDDDAGEEIPERIVENVSPGKPHLWMR